MIEKDLLTEKIIGICFKIHRELGPGFPEKVYHQAMINSMKNGAIEFVSEKEFAVYYEKKKVGAFRVDLFIEEQLIVEFKSVVGIMPIVFRNQLIAYLKASKIKTGLLINFGNKSCEVKRISV